MAVLVVKYEVDPTDDVAKVVWVNMDGTMQSMIVKNMTTAGGQLLWLEEVDTDSETPLTAAPAIYVNTHEANRLAENWLDD